jgi:hypothetical protein
MIKYRVSKKHLTGIFAGLTTKEETSVAFEVGERLRSIFTGDIYEIVAVEIVRESVAA